MHRQRTSEESQFRHPGWNTSEMAMNAQAGIPPTNDQLCEAIETTTDFLEKKQREPQLNARTRKTVADVSHVLRDVETFITEKNPDQSLQDIFVQGSLAAESVTVAASRRTTDKEKETKELIDAAGDLARLLIQSSDFRMALTELVDLIELIVFGIQRNGGAEEDLISFPEYQNNPAEGSYSYTHPGHPLAEVTPENASITSLSPSNVSLPSSTDTTLQSIRQYGWFTEDEKREIRTKFEFTLRRFVGVAEMQKGLDEFSHLMSILKAEVMDAYYNRPISTDANVRQVIYEAKVFLQRFTGEKVIDKLIISTKAFVRLIVHDQILSRYVDEFVEFFQTSCKNPQLLTQDSHHIHVLDDLISRGLDLYASIQKHPYLRDAIGACREIFKAIKNDPLRNRLEADIKVLAADFVTYDKNGNATLNFDLVTQLKSLLIPLLCEHLKDVPIPRVEGSSETFDYWVDNINFSIDQLLPEHMHVHIAGDGDIDVQSLSTDQFTTRILLTARGIRSNMHNLKFWFKRKSFPKTEDEGWAEVIVGGKVGARVLIQLTFNAQRAIPFDVHAVRFSIDELNVSISDTKHDWIYSMFISMYKSSLLEKLEIELQLRLRSIMYKINHQLNKLFDNTRDALTATASHALIGL